MNRGKKPAGFTVVELVVTMMVSSIIVGGLIGAVTLFISNVALTDTRNGVPVDLQAGLQKIAGIIRSSDNVLLYNLTPDSNAPIAKVGEAANVPGPSNIPADDDYNYFWRSTSNQLILAQPSRNASGAPIYTDPANGDFTGPRDSVVLYLKGKALYERIVYSTQSATSTVNCPGTTQTGGCSSDVRLVDNIKLVNGVPQFSLTYLDSAGVAIPATLPNGTNNYNARKLTRAIKVDLTLEVEVGSRKVTSHDTSTVSFRTGYIPGSTVIGGSTGGIGTPPAPPYSMTGMYIGPGGLSMGSLSNFTGSQLNVQGRIGMSTFAQIGASGAPTVLNVDNQACGTPPSWPTVCSGVQPISGPGSFGTTIYGKVCATGQVSGAGMTQTGLQPSCTAPAISMPTYDRLTFMNSMKSQRPGANGSCSLANFSPKTLDADTLYVGSLTNDYIFCTMTIKGNIYVKGDISSSSIISLRVDESVGKKRPLVVVEGNIYFSAFDQIIPNSYGTGIDFISFGSANPNCLTTPACADRTDPSLLYKSYNKPTITLNAMTATGSTFYSYYGGVSIGSLTTVGGVSGQTVSMTSATVHGP